MSSEWGYLILEKQCQNAMKIEELFSTSDSSVDFISNLWTAIFYRMMSREGGRRA